MRFGICLWPRSWYSHFRTSQGHNPHSMFTQADRTEILSYIAQNGPVSRFDIELCCHQTKKPVTRHLAALEGQHIIERCYFNGEKFRVVE